MGQKISSMGYILQLIHRKIDRRILDLVFNKMDPYGNMNLSIDNKLVNRVLKPVLLTDCAMLGGKSKQIPLNLCHIEYLEDGYSAIIIIDEQLLDNGFINTVNNITVGAMGITDNGINSVGGSVMNQMRDHSIATITDIELIGDNVLLARGLPTNAIHTGKIDLLVGNDQGFSHIPPKAVRVMGKMGILAVKEYIYTNADLEVDIGFLYKGHDLPALKDKISQMSDAGEMYDTMLDEDWSAIAMMSDKKAFSGYIGLTLGKGVAVD